MSEHKERVIRVLKKQLDRTDKKRATGAERKEIAEIISNLKNPNK